MSTSALERHGEPSAAKDREVVVHLLMREATVSAHSRKEAHMANGNAGFLRQLWNTLIAWERAMDYSPYHDAMDRIGGLEREGEQLKASTGGN